MVIMKKKKYIMKYKEDNIIWQKVYNEWLYTFFGDNMKVKVIDEGHEGDLEKEVNKFISENDIDVVDIKFSTSCSIYSEEQIYCFSAMIIYNNKKDG